MKHFLSLLLFFSCIQIIKIESHIDMAAWMKHLEKSSIITINSFEDIKKDAFEYRPSVNADNIGFAHNTMSNEDFECYCVQANKKPLMLFNIIDDIQKNECIRRLCGINEDNEQLLEEIKNGNHSSTFGLIDLGIQKNDMISMHDYIFYRKEYEQQAHALEVLKNTRQGSDIIVGLLLGYSLRDIEELYQWSSDLNIQTDLQEDLALAHEINAPAFIEQQLKELATMTAEKK